MPDGVQIPGGPVFIGFPQPADVPCDPTGSGWRGPPGPVGPQGVPGTDGGALSGLVNVTEHGAKGDGTTDDTAAIQAVLNAYAGKATVFVPDTGQSYRIATVLVPTGTDLLIYGTILALPGTGVMLDVLNASNVTIRGHGTVDGNHTTVTSGLEVCLNCDTATNVRISGLTLQNSTNFNLSITNSSYVYVDSVRLLGGVNASGFNWSHHCWITRSYINTGSNDDGWAFYGGCSDCGISNCETTGARVAGISVYADGAGPGPGYSTNIVIADNISHDNGENGIEVRSGEPPYYIHTGITITGNRCYANSAFSDPQCADIWLSSADGVTVSGNNLSGSGSGPSPAWGIWVGQHAAHVSITGNAIWNEGKGGAAGVGIYLQVANDVLIEGNYFYDNQTTPTMVTAIDGTAGQRCAITGNFFGGLGGGPVNMIPAVDTVLANSMFGVWTAGVGTRTSGAAMSINAASGTTGMLQYRSNSHMRWFVGTDGATASGGNTGDAYTLVSVDDDGTTLHRAMSIDRATHQMTLAVAPTITTLPINAANDAAAAAAGVPPGGEYRNGSVKMIRVA